MKMKRNENKTKQNSKGSPKNKTGVLFSNSPSYFLKRKIKT